MCSNVSRSAFITPRPIALSGWQQISSRYRQTATTDIYFDESGYTGTDLSNPEQPFFVIASSTLGDADAKTLLEDSFPGYQGAEFKFTNIWRRDRHRRNLERFVTKLAEVEKSVFVWGIDKRFCLLTKMIDYVIE
ncbi:MAG: DUF3800 domain-containing protein, partial [Sphingopyxis sp.]